MNTTTQIVLALLALQHAYILYFEMFAWEKTGPKLFRKQPPEFFSKTKAMAANQGLYNGFLSAGLLWSLWIDDPVWAFYTAVFFCTCVLAAGLYGGFTVSKKIWTFQALPAGIALILLHL